MDQVQPRQTRPEMPEGYGVPDDTEGMVPWSWAEERLRDATNYWVGTVRADGRPHAVPIWGAWLDGRFWFEGSPDTQRGRNLARNPAVVVHVERGDEVVIVEGVAEQVGRPDPAFAARLADAFGAKYEPKYGYRPKADSWDEGGLYAVMPRKVLAWGAFPTTTTRFLFGADR